MNSSPAIWIAAHRGGASGEYVGLNPTSYIMPELRALAERPGSDCGSAGIGRPDAFVGIRD
jgi:hypothetical protein